MIESFLEKFINHSGMLLLIFCVLIYVQPIPIPNNPSEISCVGRQIRV